MGLGATSQDASNILAQISVSHMEDQFINFKNKSPPSTHTQKTQKQTLKST